jgi:hypothetical protein
MLEQGMKILPHRGRWQPERLAEGPPSTTLRAVPLPRWGRIS